MDENEKKEPETAQEPPKPENYSRYMGTLNRIYRRNNNPQRKKLGDGIGSLKKGQQPAAPAPEPGKKDRSFLAVAGGAIVLSALHRAGIDITTHIAECAGIADTRFAQDDAAQLAAQVEALASKPEGFAVLDETVEEPMKAAIRAAGAEGDSVGGMLETAILGLPAGIGEPYFDSVESEIAHLAFSVPAVKGIEFGTGFGFAGMRGSEANDAFRMTPEGAVVTATNHNAGINGGIANGMPVVFRTVVKPTPSIYKQQDTVDYLAKKDAQLSIQGRHDPCIVPRAAIVQTCAAALAVGDLLTARYGEAWMTHPTSFRKEDE